MALSLTCLLLLCRSFRPTCQYTLWFHLSFEYKLKGLVRVTNYMDEDDTTLISFTFFYWYRPFHCLDSYESGDDCCLITGRKRARFDEFFF